MFNIYGKSGQIVFVTNYKAVAQTAVMKGCKVTRTLFGVETDPVTLGWNPTTGKFARW